MNNEYNRDINICSNDSDKENAVKKTDFIRTFTGKDFYSLEPDIDSIDILDIAHALSLLCRGNGQIKNFFSVGQHCVNCCIEAEARGYSNRVILACLLHDAGEAYMSDVPRPLKAFMPKYREAEDKIIDLIYTKYLGSTLTEEEKALVKKIDDDMLYFDLKYLLGFETADAEPKMSSSFSQETESFHITEENYLTLFFNYIDDDIQNDLYPDPSDRKACLIQAAWLAMEPDAVSSCKKFINVKIYKYETDIKNNNYIA